MKKRYIILPLLCIAVLAAIIIGITVAMNGKYLDKLSYDYVSSVSYNGIDIVGEDGLFYLVKDGKRISEGYTSLKSVNDYYGDRLDTKQDCEIVLFDYYLARSAENFELLLVSSEGEEYIIEGGDYSLDTANTCLPYLVFNNNQNGLKAAISLHRIDSDISYKSGNELTLRTFKAVTPICTLERDGLLCSYLATAEISDGIQQYSYFRHDGIKITGGSQISVIELYREGERQKYPFFYNVDAKQIVLVNGDVVASDVAGILREGEHDWQYALCQDGQAQIDEIVAFSPDGYMSFSSADYDIGSVWYHGDCIIAARKDAEVYDVTNIFTQKSSAYKSVTLNSPLLTATTDNGTFAYLDRSGAVILKSNYGDMLIDVALSTDDCFVLSSESEGASYKFFARANFEPYKLDTADITVSRLENTDGISAYRITKNADGTHALLAPHSPVKLSKYYDSLEYLSEGGIAWVLAKSNSLGVYDILDPLSARIPTSFKYADGGIDNLTFEYKDSISLNASADDESGSLTLSIVKLTKPSADKLRPTTHYIALYRSALSDSKAFDSAPLYCAELGSNLRTDTPYSVYPDNREYLVTHSALGSSIFELDASCILTSVCVLPYRAVDILEDETTNTYYFKVRTDADMYGLYNTSAECILPTYYSQIHHAENGYFIVSLRDAYGVVRSGAGGAKTVIDFSYVSITPLGDNGYLAIDGERHASIYSGKKLLMSDPVQSVREICNYSTDAQGKLVKNTYTLMNINGSLYIHR